MYHGQCAAVGCVISAGDLDFGRCFLLLWMRPAAQPGPGFKAPRETPQPLLRRGQKLAELLA
jgi:hypothetical protein